MARKIIKKEKRNVKEENEERDDNEDILRVILFVRVAFKIDHLENDC